MTTSSFQIYPLFLHNSEYQAKYCAHFKRSRLPDARLLVRKIEDFIVGK